jgi:hypothetical protein
MHQKHGKKRKKNRQMGLHQILKLHSKRNNQWNEKATHEMREIFSNPHI